jgi:HD-GYP domain
MDFLINYLNRAHQALASVDFSAFLTAGNLLTAGLALAALILLIALIARNRKIRYLLNADALKQRVMLQLDRTKSLEENLFFLLEALSGIVTAASSAAYVYDEKSGELLLKTVRQKNEEFSTISPAYNGLVPYKKDAFILPSSLPRNTVPEQLSIHKEGEVSLLFIPLDGKNLIVIGPVKRIPKKSFSLIQSIVSGFNPVLKYLLEKEELSKKISVANVSQLALKNISAAFTDFTFMVNLIITVALKAVGASGGMMITMAGGGGKIETVIGLEKETEELVKSDGSVCGLFDKLLGSAEFRQINKTEQEFFTIPPYFLSEGAETFFAVRIPTDRLRCFLILWNNGALDFKDYQGKVLDVMAKRMADIIDSQQRFKELSGSYIDILKMLSRLTDGLRPHSIGYSDLMYRYAYIIAKELALEEKDRKEIALAAYFSNIGVIGISEDILFKQGKFTENEYELMKLHSETGAAIIEATIYNANIASYIRHHHERLDGFGYPAGLKGDEIPTGSKIILVVQTFLAKILSREYRPALPFEQAVKQLYAAADTQLDRHIINALVGWFNKKQDAARSYDGPLGSCWEMRCSPENICVHCPAYKNSCKRCWEIKGVACTEHGDECAHCFIYSEFLWRTRHGGNELG